ncbi:MAG: ribonuclease R [Candidatus Cloacimonadota bacterium]|nr:MAG: ribonuclease R [Candidatus Cloacimonadota bacterium]
MFDSKIAYKVKSLLSANRDQHFKIKDIARDIRLKKHKHKDLIDTLFALAKEEKIAVKGRTYSYKNTESKRARKARKMGNSPSSNNGNSHHKVLQGTFDSTSLARNKTYAFVITDSVDVFVSAEDTLNAYHKDKVEVEVRYGRQGKQFGIITRIVERAREQIVGKVQDYRGQYFLIPDNSRIHTNFMINKKDVPLKDTKDMKVVLQVTNWGNRELQKLPAGEIVEILGKAGDPDVEILSVIKQYGLPLTFPDEVIAELNDLSDEITEEEIALRRDLRELPTLTIDPASAKDFDDAISFISTDNGYKHYVHIADVAHYVKPGMKLFEEAAKRGNSFYFPKRVIPMLPEKISNKICSLRPYEEKLTVTVQTNLDKNNRITSQKVYESVIKSNVRFNYEEIDTLFAGKETKINPEISEMLFEMKKISAFLLEKRKQKGYLHFDLPETEFIFDEEGHISDLQRSSETESHQLIENFMLIANEYIATRLSRQNTIYRIHEQPDEKKLLNMKDIVKRYEMKLNLQQNYNYALQQLLDDMPSPLYHRVFDRMILRSMKRARYSVENEGHFGLAIQNYTHFTSPIRRLCDLIVHHQIKDLINNRKERFNRKEIFDFAGVGTEQESLADESEREVEMKNKLIFMKKKLGEEYDGIIVGVKPSGLIVEIDRYPITGVIPISSIKGEYLEYDDRYMMLIGKTSGLIFKLTDKVKVQVSNIDDEVKFQLIKKYE